MLDHITPVVLTRNEEQNIARTLSHLTWAKDVILVDGGSTDGTLAAVAKFPNVRVFDRRFDTHGNQWRFAVEETQIATNWMRLSAPIVSGLITRFSPTASYLPSILQTRFFCAEVASWCGTKATLRLGR
jgi:Glycosyl transferase family 2